MLNNSKNGVKTAVDNMRKISSGWYKHFYKAIGAVVGTLVSIYAVKYYKDATRDDAKVRADAISCSTLQKQYVSVRVKDVELIKKRLTRKPDEIHNKFSVLVGPRGIGKTVAIQSAAENLTGIISFFID